ncbi:MAG: tRNA (adenosine(37)-N6)-threonylcarbamoyltransferase complex dimerization subunit type 1 TsaB [Rhodothermaceae bacterium]|nr:tRNA (adenosine(37)-N6)-threonylcarbamoyltransferase complex dimerization subunit type 1 TsaB [Rhodothermaceae bacterium]
MLLLGIETATDVCSVALLDGEALLAETSLFVPRSHAARLAPLIQEMLAHTGRTAADLDAIAVSAGPGSFTGLRIGASTAKGLAVAADAVLVAVPTLDALAQAAWPAPDPTPVLVTLPSRRGEVYGALYRPDVAGLVHAREAKALTLAEIKAWLPEEEALRLLGPGSSLVVEAAEQAGLARTFDVPEASPSATRVARLGRARWEAGETENVAAWEPFYLKAFVAKPPRPIFGATAEREGR